MLAKVIDPGWTPEWLYSQDVELASLLEVELGVGNYRNE